VFRRAQISARLSTSWTIRSGWVCWCHCHSYWGWFSSICSKGKLSKSFMLYCDIVVLWVFVKKTRLRLLSTKRMLHYIISKMRCKEKSVLLIRVELFLVILRSAINFFWYWAIEINSCLHVSPLFLQQPARFDSYGGTNPSYEALYGS